MIQDFDPGYGHEPFRSLCREFPDAAVYPAQHFRLEWGAVFHRGRLDGTAQVLIIGLAPGMLEVVLRRVIVGHAGQRLQGFLAKLGIERSYVMINAFLYSAYGQAGCVAIQDDPAVVAYRHRWIDAIMASSPIRAVITLGARADSAWRLWQEQHGGPGQGPLCVKMPHPTQPESSAKGDPDRYAAAMATMLREWNAALAKLKPVLTPDRERPLVPYASDLVPSDVLPVPTCDLPAGTPAWMGDRDHWTKRSGDSPKIKRGNLTINIPPDQLPS
jgi:uracil-DNA glycosylase